MTDVLPGTDIPIPAGAETLGQRSVLDAITMMQRAGGWAGPFTGGILLEPVTVVTEGGSMPPYWPVWYDGQVGRAFVGGGHVIYPGLNDYAPWQFVFLVMPGRVGTVLMRLASMAEMFGLLGLS